MSDAELRSRTEGMLRAIWMRKTHGGSLPSTAEALLDLYQQERERRESLPQATPPSTPDGNHDGAGS